MGLISSQGIPLPFVFTTITSLTTHGNLQLCVYTPTSSDTVKHFNDIVKELGNNEVYPLATWPNKQLGQIWSPEAWRQVRNRETLTRG